jgi:hypothetical protein
MRRLLLLAAALVLGCNAGPAQVCLLSRVQVLTFRYKPQVRGWVHVVAVMVKQGLNADLSRNWSALRASAINLRIVP